MSRRRYISTDISIDRKVRRLSDAAALFYTWMIPHAEEDATITSDPEELQAIIVPNRPGWTPAKVGRCVEEIELMELVKVQNSLIYFPPSSFYRYQSNVHSERRRTEEPLQTRDNSAEQRGTAQRSASPSPSPSPSEHMLDKSSAFDLFWSTYPRKQGKGDARKSWDRATKKAKPAAIIAGLKRHLPVWAKDEARFIPFPATWLNQERWSDELTVRVSTSTPFVAPEEVEITPEERAASVEVLRRARLSAGKPLPPSDDFTGIDFGPEAVTG